jgi:hypothetical protein
MCYATAANLVPRYGLLREMKLYRKNLNDFRAMDRSAGFGYVLWVVELNQLLGRNHFL